MRIKKRPANPPHLLPLRTKLNLSQERFGWLIEVSHRTVWRWEREGSIDFESKQFIKELEQLADELLGFMTTQDVVRWLSKPNSELRYTTPAANMRFKLGAELVKELVQAMKVRPVQRKLIF